MVRPKKDPWGLSPKAAVWERVPTGPSLGAPCPYPRRESRVVKPHELLFKGSGIKAVFSLAPLPRRLTLGLTVADRWECSQATGPPAWRHQDLSTSQPLGHTVSQALKQKNLY